MTDFRLDVLAIGDAIVDVIATADDAFLQEEGLPKGSMRLIDAAEATRLYSHMGQARETSGGSAANTMAGIAALGGRAGFVGQVARDQLGEIFAHDIRALGVEFTTPPCDTDEPTGRCLILVTPDGQRTMNTSPGASHSLSVSALDEQQIRDSAILYLEAYLWVPDSPRAAMERAIEIAHAAGRRVAFTLSDIACIAKRRDSFLDLIQARAIDMLFANEAEVKALAGIDAFDPALAALQDKVPLIVCTCSERGAVAVENGRRVAVPAAPVERVVDTTGAGDLFAAGFLSGQALERPLEECLRRGAIAAAEIISHFGARPEADLKALMA
ncbi:adenosine kinase [Sphingomonas parva]|uniref:adenosine kinase n=1 Tax=Sphingomonas parva TaxID=2555898 RepID=UPI001CDC567B|nr:adenosine kinase [Sphingomonas parva]